MMTTPTVANLVIEGPRIGTVALLEDSVRVTPAAGEETIQRVIAHVAALPALVRPHAENLISRHGYVSKADGSGPHTNVLGHPVLQLPIWVDAAGGGALDDDTMSDILESSLFGYLSVRAEDDYFDGDWDDPKAAMMLSGVFRARHQTLLARHISHDLFWRRFEQVWSGYADAMLRESALNHASSEYGPDDFDRVLARSQPLEIPASAVLSLDGRWEQAALGAQLVRHLTKATQLFDDFVDAPIDLASGNHTWMVRRLGGGDGAKSLRRNMVESCDQVFAEAIDELDRALACGDDMGLEGLPPWVNARKAAMSRAAQRLYQSLFENMHAARASGRSGSA